MTGPEYEAIKKLAARADNGAEIVQITKRDLRMLLEDHSGLFLGLCIGIVIGFVITAMSFHIGRFP